MQGFARDNQILRKRCFPAWQQGDHWAGLDKMRQIEKGHFMAGRLTTHVLDTARGKPADGIRIVLYRVTADSRRKIAEAETNTDGRTDAPMLQGDAFGPGGYELVFCAGDYLRRTGQATGEVLFLDEIPIRFGIADAGQHFHVPLLLSAFGYSTYRGS